MSRSVIELRVYVLEVIDTFATSLNDAETFCRCFLLSDYLLNMYLNVSFQTATTNLVYLIYVSYSQLIDGFVTNK